MTFLSPHYLFLLGVIPLLYLLQKRQSPGRLWFPSIKGLKTAAPRRLMTRNYIRGLSHVILFLIAVAAARPHITVGGGKVPSEGIDIVMVIDVSGSMKSMDKLPLGIRKGGVSGMAAPDMETRLAKVKRVSRQFVKTRKEDRVGVIAFAGKSVIISPLSQDYRLIDKQIASLDFNLTTDGTALGMAVASGINMLKESSRKEKTLIILTDGINNSGDIEPVQAAYLAKNFNVKIYTIEMGSFAENEVLREQSDWEGAEPRLLEKISAFTGGRHFVIPDSGRLYAVYNEIEKAEKSKVDVTGYADYVEIYPHLVLAAVVFMVMQIVLLNTRYMKIP